MQVIAEKTYGFTPPSGWDGTLLDLVLNTANPYDKWALVVETFAAHGMTDDLRCWLWSVIEEVDDATIRLVIRSYLSDGEYYCVGRCLAEMLGRCRFVLRFVNYLDRLEA